MTNKAIARILKETAMLVELTGGNPFRARAYANAARTIERMETPVADRLGSGRLTDVPGIGAGLEAQIREIVARGSFDLRDELLNAVPTGLLDVLRVKGLGPKKVRRLWQALGVASLEDLEHAALTGRLASLDGFGKRTEQSILEQIGLLRQYSSRRRLADAFAQTTPLFETLRAEAAVGEVSYAGEMRRALETVGAAEMTVTGDAETVRRVLDAHLDGVRRTERPDATTFTGTLPDGFTFHLHLAGPERFGTELWRQTGSGTHVEAFVKRFGEPPPFPTETALFAHFGLPFIPPELREGDDEIDLAADGALPKLVTLEDLRGSLHNHSTYSDGAHSLQEMAEAARARGLSYFGICDHSRSLTVAHGMPIPRVRRQHEEIDRLNARYAEDGGAPFRIFAGIESDILADGSLDYPDEVLASFDLVVASIHSGFNMTEAEATARLIRAVENPFTTILGHPTGRLLLAREGYPIDHEAVIEACAAHGVAIELNANPYRLDLDWRWIRAATERGVLIAVNPDAHATEQLDLVRWGVATGRKGYLTADQCLNARSLEAFTAWLENRKARRPA
ncbi:DNA polymerase/3'-5' exonuclease PolX [Rhodocaloribacter sp.]